jgi:hypothetical protein
MLYLKVKDKALSVNTPLAKHGSPGAGFLGPMNFQVGVKMMVLLEAVRHATPQQSKRHHL